MPDYNYGIFGTMARQYPLLDFIEKYKNKRTNSSFLVKLFNQITVLQKFT